MSPYESFVHAVEQTTGRTGKRAGKNIRLVCPAHDDHDPSLDVAEGDNGAPVVQCRSHGCTYDQVCAAIGREPSEFAPTQQGEWTPHGTAIATYPYHDAERHLLYEVCRTPDKQFPVRRPDINAKSGWQWNLKGIERVLYRLPDVLAAAAEGRTVYVCEGEKDADAIRRAGGVGTCNPGGAGKWNPAYNNALRGAHVIIVADNDEPGLAHARKVAASLGALNGSAPHVTLTRAKTGKDAADHLAAGHTLDELVPLDITTDAQPVEDPTVTLDEFVARKAADVEPLATCDHGTVIPAGGLVLHAGKASAGKTTHALDLILHAAAGLDYCGLQFPRPLRILLIENEGPREGFRAKLEERLPHGPTPSEPIRIWDDQAYWGMVRVSEDDLRSQLRNIIEQHRTDLVVSDSLTRFGMSGNGTPEETRDFMLLLNDAGLGTRAGFLILAHTRTRTDQEGDELEQLAGAWAPHADTILMLRKLGGNRARLSYPKTRWTRGVVPTAILSFEPTTETFTLVHSETEEPETVDASTYEQRILEYLADNPWATTDNVDKGVTGRVSEVRKARQRLAEEGRITSSPSAALGRPGRDMRWNRMDTADNPVPLPGTGQDGETGSPQERTQPRPPVPTKEGKGLRDGARDGEAEQPPDDDGWDTFPL